jgi:hypothetical protein
MQIRGFYMAICAIHFLVLLGISDAAAELLVLPGNSRAISHTLSASRDNAIPGYEFTPREVQRGGLDFAFLGYKFPRHTLRLGFFGMMEIQSDVEDPEPWLLGRQTVSLWRGVWGFSTALSFDKFASEHWGDRANLEFAVDLRHESDHETDGQNPDYELVPIIGDFVKPEIAVRMPWKQFDFDLRLQHKFFFNAYGYSDGYPGGLPYTHGPGGDLVARWHMNRRFDPFASSFYEYVWGGEADYYGLNLNIPDHHLFRQLAGVIVKGRAANLHLYTSWSIGHDKGLLAFHEDRLWGWGLRVDIFGE